MSAKSLARLNETIPSVFDDFFKPWKEWFENGGMIGRMLKVPAVNITEHEKEYQVALAAPGLKKDDFKIDMDGNMVTISSEKSKAKKIQTNAIREKNIAILLSAAVLHYPKM